VASARRRRELTGAAAVLAVLALLALVGLRILVQEDGINALTRPASPANVFTPEEQEKQEQEHNPSSTEQSTSTSTGETTTSLPGDETSTTLAGPSTTVAAGAVTGDPTGAVTTAPPGRANNPAPPGGGGGGGGGGGVPVTATATISVTPSAMPAQWSMGRPIGPSAGAAASVAPVLQWSVASSGGAVTVQVTGPNVSSSAPNGPARLCPGTSDGTTCVARAGAHVYEIVVRGPGGQELDRKTATLNVG
jgi:hypothetical protein